MRISKQAAVCFALGISGWVGAVGASDWSTFGGGLSFQRYSPEAQIDAGNFAHLKLLWSRYAIDKIYLDRFPDLSPSAYLKGTPTVVDGVGYVSNGVGLVEAFDPATGATKWVQTPIPYTFRQAARGGLRGVSFWRDGADQRIIASRGEFLYSLDARTGKPIKSFGDDGRVYLGWPTEFHYPYLSRTGPTVVGDVIVVGGTSLGSGTGDAGDRKEGIPEDVRAYDVRTGRQLWTFHVIPREGEPGIESWQSDAWQYSGTQAAWGPITADPDLGLVYLPLSAPSLPYGGFRPGNNLFGDSLVAVHASTGKLAWYFQMVHHDLWDYDVSSPPVLGEVKVDNKRIKIVMQATKSGYVYVFDRETGKPVWPIVERPVPQSTVPGEHTSPTQPIPVKPAPLDMIGVTENDLADFTPEIKKEAREIASHMVLGAGFTPPSLRDDKPGGKLGTLLAPGTFGAGNWNTGAFDPETGRYYAITDNIPTLFGLIPAPDPEATVDYILPSPRAEGQQGGAGNTAVDHGYIAGPVTLKSGLPIIKPPYGRITAYDMNKGDKLWSVANGDNELVRNNPALKGLKLPLLGRQDRIPMLVTRTLLLVPDGSSALGSGVGTSGPAKLRAYDKKTGKFIAAVDLPAPATGGPISYTVNGRQIILVPVGDSNYGPHWVALGL